MKPSLLVLAAGIGSRYGGLKQIEPVGPSGEIIIDYSIFDAIRAGFGKIVFVIRKDIEESFRECIGRRFENKIHVEYSFQEMDMLPEGFKLPGGRVKPWGTGHAIMVAAKQINEPFAAINADDFYGKSGYSLLAKHLSSLSNSSTEYCMVGFRLKNTLSEFGTVSRGICANDSNSYLTSVIERTKIERTGEAARFFDEAGKACPLTGNEIVSLNMWGFTPSLFDFLKEQFAEFLAANSSNLKAEFFIPTVADRLIKDKKARLKVLKSEDQWFGITYKEDKPDVTAGISKLIDRGVYPSKLF